MRWYVRHFYDVGLAVGFIALACGVLVSLDTLQQILLLSFAVLCVHEFEEYGWPGGFPSYMNRVMFPKIAARLGKESGPSDRYILNQVNSVFVNVLAAYPFYAVPIFFPDLIWLGLAPILFNLVELLIHGVGAVVATKSPYNPGLLSCLPWLVLSVWYIVEVTRNDLASGADWAIAVGYLIVWIVVALPVGTFVLLSDRNSRYPFAPEELSRFEKYTRRIHTVIHP
ncbi:HXXEE domain-containing protein [Kribbella pittospori]|uniref:HXXEE domain-containing protein n=1 Tax=Kribbella pittospori TaxID=722689 RepID=A0A4R0JSP1_9ACTN|nr:HXXEE domain-containing protein [Kribbella pittospori]TCC50401.1 HXXEE domain-containing protein [Kribbella pittospori]